MRLSDLTNPADYIPTEAALAEFLNQIDGLRPDHIDAGFQGKSADQVEEKLFDVISGMQSLNRRWR